MTGKKEMRQALKYLCDYRFVLTAAHCVDEDTSDVDVVLGKHWYIDHKN